MPKPAPFKSDFLILDVKKGRHQLARRIVGGEEVAVWIYAILDRQHGRDDGVSIEFSGVVHSVKVAL